MEGKGGGKGGGKEKVGRGLSLKFNLSSYRIQKMKLSVDILYKYKERAL